MGPISSFKSLDSLGSQRLFTQSPLSSMPKRAASGGIVGAVLFGFAFGVSGCQAPSASIPTTTGQAAPRTRSVASDITAKGNIRTGAAYKKAVAAYHARHYADALRLVNALLDTHDLPAEDEVFLSRQKQLCQAALSGKSSADAPKAVATSIPVRVKRPSTDCGPRALLLLCEAQRISTTLPSLVKAAHTNSDGTSMDGLASAAQSVGFHAEGVQMDKDALTTLSRPAIAWVDGNHYVAVLNVHANPWTGRTSVTIHDPNRSEQEELSPATLLSRSGGVLLVLSPTKDKKAS